MSCNTRNTVLEVLAVLGGGVLGAEYSSQTRRLMWVVLTCTSQPSLLQQHLKLPQCTVWNPAGGNPLKPHPPKDYPLEPECGATTLCGPFFFLPSRTPPFVWSALSFFQPLNCQPPAVIHYSLLIDKIQENRYSAWLLHRQHCRHVLAGWISHGIHHKCYP